MRDLTVKNDVVVEEMIDDEEEEDDLCSIFICSCVEL